MAEEFIQLGNMCNLKHATPYDWYLKIHIHVSIKKYVYKIDKHQIKYSGYSSGEGGEEYEESHTRLIEHYWNYIV